MQQTTEVQNQKKDMADLLQKIAAKYDPLQIYCFHKEESIRKTEGCFDTSADSQLADYWLLIVLENISRIENALQDFANAHYDFGKVTVLAHGRDGIIRSIQDGCTFFAKVCRTGKLVYTRPLANTELFARLLFPADKTDQLQQGFEEGISRAEGFLKCALECRADKRYNISAFLLH